MQLRLDAADRLVELVEERRGPVSAEEAAQRLFALRSAPVGLARSLLEEVVASDARVAWRGDCVGLEQPLGADLPLERATYVVVDLETTGLRPGIARICEIGAGRRHGRSRASAAREPHVACRTRIVGTVFRNRRAAVPPRTS